ncbi:hypothetical protein PAMP_016242 [Pampus punctatissimus]
MLFSAALFDNAREPVETRLQNGGGEGGGGGGGDDILQREDGPLCAAEIGSELQKQFAILPDSAERAALSRCWIALREKFHFLVSY